MVKQWVRFLCLLTLSLLLIILQLYWNFYTDSGLHKNLQLFKDFKYLTRNYTASECVKGVLIWWDPRFARENHGYGGKEGVIQCQDVKCLVNITYAEDETLLDGADVVIFHASYHTTIENYQLFQSKRSPSQVWIWQTWESPTRLSSFIKKPPPWFIFNLTMSYNSDSDIVVPYGRYAPLGRPMDMFESKNWLLGKTKSIAWVASNCRDTRWKRFEFVKYLQTRLEIDIYGSCGNLSCPGWNKPCTNLKEYKFFLAFENSVCTDYITEKFWSWPFLYDLDLIPIVYGTSRKEYEKVAPPNSFIHVSDFDSLDQFADYIHLLESNVDLYNKFFEWKRFGYIIKGNDNFTPSRICSIFHGPTTTQHNISKEWWDGKCLRNKNPSFWNLLQA